MLIRKCTCGRLLGVRLWPLRWRGVSHGICAECAGRYYGAGARARIERESMERLQQRRDALIQVGAVLCFGALVVIGIIELIKGL